QPFREHDPWPECDRDERHIARLRIARGNADAEDLAENEGVDRELRERMQERPREAADASRVPAEDLAPREGQEQPSPTGTLRQRLVDRIHGVGRHGRRQEAAAALARCSARSMASRSANHSRAYSHSRYSEKYG